MKNMLAGLLGAGLVLGMAPAMAGEWRLDARRCTVVDQRDGRYDARDNGRYDQRDNGRYDARDNGRYDARDNSRNDRRDSRGRDNRRGSQSITICPRSAWVYVPDRREIARGYDRDRNGYYPRGREGRYERNNRYKQPTLTLSFDNNQGLSFRMESGRRYYVR